VRRMASHRQTGDAGGGRSTMPAGVRRALLVGVGLLLAGALYLIAVRGEALLAALSSLSAYCGF
jgi:hypothetical protein